VEEKHTGNETSRNKFDLKYHSQRDTEEDSHSLINHVLESQKLGVFASDKQGLPYTTLVAFIHSPDLMHIYFATYKDTRKYENIQKNPKVSILIDDRENKSSDFYKATAITAEGVAETLDPPFSTLKEKFLNKHPHLADFINSRSARMIRIKVKKYNVVGRFQNVKIVEMQEN